MNWAWPASLDHLLRSPAFPMWATLAAAGFFGIVTLITVLRAERSVANGALTVITLLAVGIAVAATTRGSGPTGRGAAGEVRLAPQPGVASPALACIDDLAGDIVQAACEKGLFGSAESTAAAVAYAAGQVSRLTALGDASANRSLGSEMLALRRALERDRYGLVAQALQARDRCTPTQCAAFRSLTDPRQIASNMEQHIYDGLVTRYAPSWNAPPAPAPGAALAGFAPTLPTGKPTNAEFPSAANTPPVSIMTAEPGTSAARAAAPPAATAPSPAARPSAAAASAQASAKKPPAPKPRAPAAAPVQIAPAASAPESAPAASND